jgi:hypothetical protein
MSIFVIAVPVLQRSFANLTSFFLIFIHIIILFNYFNYNLTQTTILYTLNHVFKHVLYYYFFMYYFKIIVSKNLLNSEEFYLKSFIFKTKKTIFNRRNLFEVLSNNKKKNNLLSWQKNIFIFILNYIRLILRTKAFLF